MLELKHTEARPATRPIAERIERVRRPRGVWALVALIGLLAAGGLDGGLSFVLDRTGASLGASLMVLLGFAHGQI